MVETIHKCEKCGRRDFKNIGAAKVHERMPIKEGDYEGLILKNDQNRYFLFSKKGSVDYKNHERIYSLHEIKKVKEKDKLYLPYLEDKILWVDPINECHALTRINEYIEKGKWKSLTKDEFSELTEILLDGEKVSFEIYDLREIKNFKTI